MSTTKHAVPKAPATNEPLARAALIVCAHGQGGTSGISDAHAAAIRRSRRFARVISCCLNGRPDLASSLSGLSQREIYVVPLLTADGHTYSAIPPILEAHTPRAGTRVHLCAPLGQAPGLPRITMDLAADVCAAHGWVHQETTVIVAAHGTPRSSASEQAAIGLKTAIERHQLFSAVEAGFLEQTPALADVLRATRSAHCVVIGFFMDDGIHAGTDIPRIIEDVRPDTAYTGPVGRSNRIPELIVDLVRAEAQDSL